MNKNLTDITVLLDRSGSMSACRSDVIGGLNEFIQKQKGVPGECLFSLIQFDGMNPQEKVFNAVNIRDLEGFSNFEPRGNTPLYDALGQAITATGERFRAMSEADRPGKVIFVVITDGYENASREFKQPMIAEMVKTQQDKYSWDFVFLGANIDAMKASGDVGFLMTNTAKTDYLNVGATIRATGRKIERYRDSGAKVDLAYTEAERKSFVGDHRPDKVSK